VKWSGFGSINMVLGSTTGQRGLVGFFVEWEHMKGYTQENQQVARIY